MQANLTNFSNIEFPFLSLIETISVDVVFGNPQISCAGHGICQVLSRPNKFATDCRKTKALISKLNDTVLVFSFEREVISTCLDTKYFVSPYFIMTKAYELPSWLKEKLDIEGRKCIREGQYCIHKSHDNYQVRFLLN